MKKIKAFISFWIYYPKLLVYLKEKDHPAFNMFARMGRFSYAKQYSRIKTDFDDFNRNSLPWENEVVCKWKSVYNKEPIERCVK